MKKPVSDSLITYSQALVLFKEQNLCTSVRTVKRALHKHRKLCPIQSEGYHHKRVWFSHVVALVAKLAAEANPQRKAVLS